MKKGGGGKGKKQPPPPPPEIKALRETWSAVIEVRESSKPRKVLLSPPDTRQYSFQPFDSPSSKNLKAVETVESCDMTLTLFLISGQVEGRGHENTG